MEKKILEFEGYIDVLMSKLTVRQHVKEEICREVSQSLYDKYDELLVKGHGAKESMTETLAAFEEPERLAVSFNEVHNQNISLLRAVGLLRSKKAALAAALAVILMLF